jgi:hypothetical protein
MLSHPHPPSTRPTTCSAACAAMPRPPASSARVSNGLPARVRREGPRLMIAEAQRAEIRRLFYAEHWRIGTIARALSLHPHTVRAALETARFNQRTVVRVSALDPYTDFIRITLEQYPKLRATRIHEMIVARGYAGSVGQTRRLVRRLRPRPVAEAYLRLRTLPGEQAVARGSHPPRGRVRGPSCGGAPPLRSLPADFPHRPLQ